LIFHNIIDRLKAILSVCFALSKEDNNIVQNNYIVVLI